MIGSVTEMSEEDFVQQYKYMDVLSLMRRAGNKIVCPLGIFNMNIGQRQRSTCCEIDLQQ